VFRTGSAKRAIVLCTLSTGLLSACSGIFFFGDCVSIGVPGLGISVVDARNRQSIQDGSTIIVVHNGVRDSSAIANPTPATESFFAFEQSGSFAIIVRHAGFQELTLNDVVVAADRCGHPKTAHVTAALTT